MINTNTAKDIILSTAKNFGTEQVPFMQALNRILKEDVVADRDFPPFNRVAMDGIAIDYNVFTNGKRTFKIEGIQAAGSKQISLNNTEACIEVMTGAVLPKHTNAVIRYEDVIIKNNTATITIDAVKHYQNIHPKGKDKQKGAVLITKNTKITPAEIGVIATVGKTTVTVAKLAKVIIIATGDELVDTAMQPETHQIRMSNVYTIAAALKTLQITAKIAHLKDNKTELTSTIQTYLNTYDVLLFSGAVSKGKFDFLPDVFKNLDVKKEFHKVSQRPGKPFWFGTTETACVFAFPGNPVSTFVNCLYYFYPWYATSVGLKYTEETAILNADVTFKPALTYFLQVQLSYKLGHLIATPIQGNGSGDLASLVHADAFIILPKNITTFTKGESYPIIRSK
jgi:molybdopterin molybdochelatase